MEGPQFKRVEDGPGGYPVLERVGEDSAEQVPGDEAAIAAAVQFEESEELALHNASFERRSAAYRIRLRRVLAGVGVAIVPAQELDRQPQSDSNDSPYSNVAPMVSVTPSERSEAEQNLVEVVTEGKFTTDRAAPETAPPPEARPDNEVDLIVAEWQQSIDDSYERDNQASSTELLLSEFSRAEEPELFALAEAGEINSTADVIRYFTEKPVVGAEEYSRAEYVAEVIEFDDDVPEAVQAELRHLLPGLCAQESKFNNNAKSPAGAEGIFQFMPGTWDEVAEVFTKRYNREPSKLSFKDQVVMAGIHFSNIYRRLQHFSAEQGDVLKELRALMPESFDANSHLVVPLMLTAYNTGSKRALAVAEAGLERLQGSPELVAAVTDELEREPYALLAFLVEIGSGSSEGLLDAFGGHGQEYFAKLTARLKGLKTTLSIVAQNK